MARSTPSRTAPFEHHHGCRWEGHKARFALHHENLAQLQEPTIAALVTQKLPPFAALTAQMLVGTPEMGVIGLFGQHIWAPKSAVELVTSPVFRVDLEGGFVDLRSHLLVAEASGAWAV